MTKEDLQTYVYEHIPIVERNRLTIEEVSENSVTVGGRYEEHLNHRNSVFGGSLSTALILAAWGFVRRLMDDSRESVIVIQKQEVSFLRPVVRDFRAVSEPVTADALDFFLRMLNQFGKARLTVGAAIFQEGDSATLASFSGEFVVFLKKGTPKA